MAGDRHSTLTLAAFAAPCLPLAAMTMPLVVHIPPFYASELGLGLAGVSFAFLIVRLLDMAFDPLFGGVMDRTRTKWGRFRLWLTIGAPVVLAGTWMLFMPPSEPSLTYLWVGLIILYVGQSMTVLSHMSWAAVLSPDYDQRSRIYGWWQAANVIGMLLVLLIPALLERFAGLSRGEGIAAMGWFIIILLPLSILLSIWLVPEPRITAERDRAGLSEYFELFKRASVRRLLISDIIINAGPSITGALFFFYFLSIKGFGSADAGLLLFFYFAGAFAGGPLWVRVSYGLGKHKTLALAAIVYAVIQLVVWVVPPGQFVLGAVLMFLAGLPFSAGPFLLRSMMADVADEERLMTRKDRTGLLYAILTGAIKIGSALAVFVTYQGLALFGFNGQAGAENPPQALLALQVAFTVLPATLGVLTAWIIWGYPLTSERQVEIRRLLEERDQADRASGPVPQPRFAEELHVKPTPAE
jgi:Na+/melibiose symporter-like transporter